MTVAIIGAGPIGCYLGYLLAKGGKKVTIYEMKKKIKPSLCTGLVSQEINQLIPLKQDFILNEIKHVRVHSKNKKINFKIHDYVLDRNKFDQYLAELAKKAGASIKFNKIFTQVSKIKYNHLIGADGPISVVSDRFGFEKNEFYLGKQWETLGGFNKNRYEVFLDSDSIETFGWIVPESNHKARIGFMENWINPKFVKFPKIFKKYPRIKFMAPIPIYNPQKQWQKGNVYLVGDAAGQVKATTGGGLIPGMKGAKILANCILNNKDYEKESRGLRRELNLHLKIRNFLNKFSNEDYDHLLRLMDNDRVKRVLENTSRDRPIKLVLKLLLSQPSFVSLLL